MRTVEEILARIEKRRKDDFFGFEWPEYLNALPYEKAKPYLKPEYDGKDWKVQSDEEVKKRAIDYMPFAWEKANDCRRISAGRSMYHYIAWLWLLGEDFDHIEHYEYYGKPHLVEICEYLGLDPNSWDDGQRKNNETTRVCDTCRYWIKNKTVSWRHTKDEVFFGTCSHIEEQKNSEKYVAMYSEKRDGEWVGTHFETSAKFGCVMWEHK